MRSGVIPVLLVLLAGIRLVSAEDIELYVTTSNNNANVMIIYDTSESMCAYTVFNQGPNPDISGCQPHPASRDTVARNAIISLIEGLNNVNISVMTFTSGSSDSSRGPYGGWVRFASQDIDTARNIIIQRFQNDYLAEQEINTPLEESLYEAMLYFSGDMAEAGFNPLFPDEWSVTDSMVAGRYISPITEQCQQNNIVIFTDGQGIGNRDLIIPLYANIPLSELPARTNFNPFNCQWSGCLDELAWYMNNKDINTLIPGVQTVNIYTVAGFVNNPSVVDMLDAAGTLGGGQFFNVNNEVDLRNALNNLAEDFDQQRLLQATVAPATSLDAFNSLQSSGEVYYILFEPDAGPRWRGNLKRYRQGDDNQIYDADDNLAVDSSTGFFSNTAKSFWSSAADGNTVGAGGMAEKLSRNRLAFTNAGNSNTLSDLGNKLHETNGNITAAMLGAADTAETQTILQWARGVDVDDEDGDNDTTDNRTSIGDPLHTRPQVITYFQDDSGNTPVVDRTVYFTTNDGFLHAVNTDDGSTEFSFIPADLLGNLKIYRDNANPGGDTKIYGLDGPMTTWIYDKNGDRDLLRSNNGTADADEYAYLYLTMRRGGNNIYSVDVINRSSPELKWVIYGDADNDHSTESSWQFSRLGQTWSAVKPTTVMWNGNEQAVLLFGGGYDPAIDGHATIQDSNVGNAVFMVDAERGSLLWTASSTGEDLNIPDMKYSMPAELTLVDIDQDGVTDYFFAADTGGQVFRFDINESNTVASNFATGGRIANLAGTATADARRFFEAPAVAVSSAYDAINIVVGSGFRPSPLSTQVNDRIYVIRDEHVDQAPTSYNYVSNSVITESDLYDATDNQIQDGSSTQQVVAQAALDSANGWYLRLNRGGEKLFGKPTVYNGVLVFTTFTPGFIGINNSCDPSNVGFNYLYAINIENASSVINFNTGVSDLNKADRRQLLANLAISPEPSIMNPGGQGDEICVGAECYQNALRSVGAVPLIRRLWRENR